MFEKERPFDKVWGAATLCGVVAAIGIIAAIFFRFMLFVFPESWEFWYGLCKFLHMVCLWAFRVGLPLMFALGGVAFFGNLIYRLTHKKSDDE